MTSSAKRRGVSKDRRSTHSVEVADRNRWIELHLVYIRTIARPYVVGAEARGLRKDVEALVVNGGLHPFVRETPDG
jgi:hypothetical protein